MIPEITEQKLKELCACQEGIDWFLAWQGQKDLKSVLYALIDSDHAIWANWLMVRHLNKKQKVQYAIFAAEQVLYIFEARHPNDDRPRKAIEATKAYIEDSNAPVGSAANAAMEAAHATATSAARAAYAARAVYYAASAAEDAIHVVSDNAVLYSAAQLADHDITAYAAEAANDAAYAYAYACDGVPTARVARERDLRLKMIEYGLSLLEDPK